jgi:prevent-host-death family protein
MARHAVARGASAVESLAGKASEGRLQKLVGASPSLKRLVVQARERGVVTVDEINSALPEDEISPDQLDELIAMFEEMGVTVGGAESEPESAEGEAESIPISEARQGLAELCNRVAYGGERLVIARRGKARAALVPMEDLKLLEGLEDAIDLAGAGKALREAKKVGTKPLDKVV